MREPKRRSRRPVRPRRAKHPRRPGDELAAATWPESLRVEDRMAAPPLAIRWDAPLPDAVRLFREARIRHLPVLEPEGRLVGIVTDRDLRQVVLDPRLEDVLGPRLNEALQALTVKDVMTWAVITVRPETELREAARLMHRRRIGALPVVANGRLVGILTETDIIRTFAEVLGEGVLSRPYRWALRAR